MRRADIAQVFALEQRIFPTPWTLKSYEFELERNPDSEQWVIESGNGAGETQVAGYCVCWLLGEELHIANIAVAPRFRRKGLAKRLLGFVLHRAAEKGLQSATLEVRAGNKAAQALYAGFGFVEVARRPRYYSDNHEDALLMQLPQLGATELDSETQMEGT
ncbi:MAG: ribosomal protein S18-alanine N-acetyltransferase [Anaerolineales bacterium]